MQKAIMVLKSLHGLTPGYLSDQFTNCDVVINYVVTNYSLRDSVNKLAVPLPHTNILKSSFRSCSIGINRFNRNRFWLKWLRFPIEQFFNHSWLKRGCDWFHHVVNRTMNRSIWQHCYWKRRGPVPLVLQAILRIYQTASLKKKKYCTFVPDSYHVITRKL